MGILLLLGLVVGVSAARPPEYTVREAPGFPRPIIFTTASRNTNTFHGEWVTSLNERGELLVMAPFGTHTDDTLEVSGYKSFLWDGKRWTMLPFPEGARMTAPVHLRNNGTAMYVVEFYTPYPVGPWSRYEWLTYKAGTGRPLPVPFESAVPYMVNEHGDVAGQYQVLEPHTAPDGRNFMIHVDYPFLLRDGELVDLNAVVKDRPMGVAINDRGDALITSGSSYPWNGHTGAATRVTLITKTGTQELRPPGSWNVWINGMGSKSFFGSFSTPDGGGGDFYYRNGKFIALPPRDEMFQMNSRGDMIGNASAEFASERHAVVYLEGMRYDLRDLVPPDSGWNFHFATAINDRGEVAGFGYRNGRLAVFVASPRHLIRHPFRLNENPIPR